MGNESRMQLIKEEVIESHIKNYLVCNRDMMEAPNWTSCSSKQTSPIEQIKIQPSSEGVDWSPAWEIFDPRSSHLLRDYSHMHYTSSDASLNPGRTMIKESGST